MQTHTPQRRLAGKRVAAVLVAVPLAGIDAAEHGVQIMTPADEGDPPEPKVVAPEKWFTLPATRPPGTNEEKSPVG